MKSGLEIAQEATLRPIADVAADAGLHPDEVEPYGRYKAKIDLSVLDRLADRLTSEMMIEYLVPVGSKPKDVKVGVRIVGAARLTAPSGCVSAGPRWRC